MKLARKRGMDESLLNEIINMAFVQNKPHCVMTML